MKNEFGKRVVLSGLLLLPCLPAVAQDPDFYIYLCFGQSNMCGAGSIETQDKTVNDRFQMMEPIGCSNRNQSFGEWYPAIPPLWGCNGGLGPADYFGRTMVEKLPSNIRGGVIVVAIPGCDIALFYKTGYEGYDQYNTVPSRFGESAYAWLLELAKSAQKDGVIKGMLLHQGETNNGQDDWPDKVKKVYDDFLEDLELEASETPLLVGELLYKNQGGSCGDHNKIIAKVPDVIDNSYVISAEGLAGKDQWHFTTESNRTIGKRYAEQMLTLLEPVTFRKSDQPVPFCKNGFSEINPVVLTTDAVRITLHSGFSYRVFNFCGMLMQTGNGTGELTIGNDLPAGMYFLSVRHKTDFFTGKFFKR